MTKSNLSLYVTLPVLIAALALMLSGCNKNTEQKPSPETVSIDEPNISGDTILFAEKSATARRLITAPVIETQATQLSLPGRLVWDEDHTGRILPPVAGRFSEALEAGTLGTSVNANEILAYLISPDIGTAQAEFNHAHVEFVQADKNYSRIKELLTVDGASAKDLEQAEVDLERARSDVARTEQRLKSLDVTSTVDQRFAVRSPIDGVVVERNTNPGMEWRPDQPGAAMFVVSDPTYLWCWIDAPEHMLGQLQSGMKVILHASAWPDETFDAQIDYIGDALDATSRTVKVRARLHNPGRHLKAEMYVTAEFTSHTPGTLDLPAKAVFLNHDEQQVFVKTAEGLFTRKTIVPVAVNDQWVSVAQGLNKDDEVVVDGALYLEKLLEEGAKQAAPESVAMKK